VNTKLKIISEFIEWMPQGQLNVAIKAKVFSIITLLLLVSCGQSETTIETVDITSEQNTNLSLEENLDNYFGQNLSQSSAGISLIIAKGRNKVYEKSIGLADSTNSIPVTSDTPFRLASVSKPFTAIAIAQLVERGLLNYNDSITSVLTHLDPSWQPIKISHLLTHQSGIPNFFTNRFMQSIGWDWLNNLDNRKVLNYFSENPSLDFPPGTQIQYSNTNFTLLADIIEELTGVPFAYYMQENLFNPLSLAHSYVIDKQSEPLNGQALNYGNTHLMYETNLYINGSSGQVSSTNDLWLLLVSLLESTILSQESFREMYKMHVQTGGNEGQGYGWVVGKPKSNDSTYLFHNGSNDSFKSFVALVPSTGLMLVLLSNGGDNIEIHMQRIIEIVKHEYQLN